MTELCPNCRNPIQKNSTVCIYCQAPLKKAESPGSRRPLAIGCFIIPLILVAVGFVFLYPRIKQVNKSETTTSDRETHGRTRSSKEIQAGGYINEVSGLDAYRNVMKAIQKSDAEQARKYVTNKRWKELELEPDGPNAIVELNAGCTVDTDFEVHDKNERTVLIAKGKSELARDMQGNPALKVLIVKLAKEDGQWKVFSLECHHMPPANYKEEALKWLDEQPATVGLDLNSKLQAEGLRFGVQSCFNAIDEGNALAVKRCLAVGWDPNTTDSSGRTALMIAAIECKPEIAKDLIQAKANINIKNSDGVTALRMSENCPEMKKLLIYSGAR